MRPHVFRVVRTAQGTREHISGWLLYEHRSVLQVTDTHSSLQVSGNQTKYNPCPSPDKAKGRRPSPKLANQNLLQLLNHCKKPSDLMLHAF